MHINRPKISFQGRTKVLLLCLLVATTFWFLHAMNTDHTTIISYPVEVVVLSPNESISLNKIVKSKFQVSINGNGWGLLAKKLGWHISPIKVEKNAAKEISVIAKDHRETIIYNLKDFRVNYIFPDSLHLQ